MSESPKIKLKSKIKSPSSDLEIKKKKLSITPLKENRNDSSPINKTVVFIDASFFTFYRYHATKVWYSKHTGSGSEEQCSADNPEFLEKFTKHFEDLVAKIQKKFKTDLVYWFKDAPQSEIWRMPMLPKYKDGRVQTTGINGFFKHVYSNLVSEEFLIKADTAEADDLIAIASKYEFDNHNNVNVVIVSGDSDLLQLVNERVRLVGLPKLQDLSLEMKIDKNTRIELSPKQYLEMKIIMGDKSDNISKVYTGCGPKTCYDIVCNSESFEKYINKHPERLARYKENQKLISFEHIPEDLSAQILTKYLEKRNH